MKFSESCRCVLVDDSDGDSWECPACGFRTDDDQEAREHGMSGVSILMDRLGMED